jgi:dienelactone hydrolase
MSPMQYATRLAVMGFVTMVGALLVFFQNSQSKIFDPRNYGESDGQPRQYENPAFKIEDTIAALDYLGSRVARVDTCMMFAIGICQVGTQDVHMFTSFRKFI